MIIKRIICTVCLSFITLFAFSLAAGIRTDSDRSIKIISPAPGTWSNYQSLILDVPEDAVAFYSFTGDDPLYSGFAYDGPVLIEKEGPIVLRVAAVLNDNSSTEQKIEYTVTLRPSDEEFYLRALKGAFVPLSSTLPMPLPSTVKYCIGDSQTPYISGRTLSLEVPNAVERYIPLVIQDFSSYYRVMLRLESEKEAAALANETQETFPFTINCSNWTDFTVSGADSVLFSLDGSSWTEGSGTIQLDRSIDHSILWKYEIEDDVKARSFILPAKPSLVVNQTKGSSPLKLSVSNSAFTFKKSADKISSPASSWYADGIYGEHLSTVLTVEVYFKGIRQGVLSASVSIDKQPPQKPEFNSTSNSFYARDAVTVQIKSDEQIYYAVSEPKISNFGFSDLEISALQTNGNGNLKEYTLYKNATFILSENKGGAVLYALHAYAQDSSGNVSEHESFSVVVDGYNYYVNSSITADYVSDGSPARPFTEMEDVVKVLNQKDYARLHITGNFRDVPSLAFTKDCDILGIDGAHIQFAPDSSLTIKNAAVSISGCIIEQYNKAEIKNQDDSVYQRRLFFIKDASLYLDNVDVIYSAYRNASIIQSDNSTVRLKETGLTIQALSYASGITSVGSIIGCISSSVSVIAPTAVAFSTSKGSLIMDSSSINLKADLGRVAEVSSSMYYITNNTFSYSGLSLVKVSTGLPKKTLEPVWSDYTSVQKAYTSNTLTGF